MTPISKKLIIATGALLVALSLAATANASCGDKPAAAFHRQAWEGSSAFANGSLRFVNDDNDAIVGLWHVTFTAEGNNPGPPNRTPIDNALVTWHSDGTEIMNSGRPSQDGQFCMGVWKRIRISSLCAESLRVGGERYDECANRNRQSGWSDSYHGDHYFGSGRKPLRGDIHVGRV